MATKGEVGLPLHIPAQRTAVTAADAAQQPAATKAAVAEQILTH